MRSNRGPWISWMVLAACGTGVEPHEPTTEPTAAEHASAPARPSTAAEPAVANEAPLGPPAGELDPAIAKLALQVVARYRDWGRVDDEFRWAPGLCRIPMPASARFSTSTDELSHGDKIYTVYAMDPVAYGARASAGPPAPMPGVEQVLVKEAYAPTTDPGAVGVAGRMTPAERDGTLYHPGEPRGLYMLMKLPTDQGTDAGWVYATVMPDNVTVTSAGLVQRCMGCHREAPHERWFGLPQGSRGAL